MILFYVIEGLELLIFVILFLFVKSYLPSYFSAKGKNLATKEDIAEITKKTEEIRVLYSKQLEFLSQQNRIILEEYKSKNQLRLAALTKRLEVHQNAFILWKKIISSVHHESISDVVIECQQWWNENCLYLTVNAREAFWKSFNSADMHEGLLEENRRLHNADSKKDLTDNWEYIMNAGKVIAAGVTLPPTDEQLQIEELDS
jgi:hypothetical protein